MADSTRPQSRSRNLVVQRCMVSAVDVSGWSMPKLRIPKWVRNPLDSRCLIGFCQNIESSRNLLNLIQLELGCQQGRLPRVLAITISICLRIDTSLRPQLAIPATLGGGLEHFPKNLLHILACGANGCCWSRPAQPPHWPKFRFQNLETRISILKWLHVADDCDP